MKICIALCLFALSAVALGRPEDKYTDKYDGINLDEILGNQRLLHGYLNCMLGTGKCTSEGKELQSHIREALSNNCAKCTDTQKTESRRVIGHLINHEASYWSRLTAKFDPEAKYVAMYEKDLKEVKTQA